MRRAREPMPRAVRIDLADPCPYTRRPVDVRRFFSTEFNSEADLSAERAGAQASARVPCPQGDRRRTLGVEAAPHAGAEAPFGLTEMPRGGRSTGPVEKACRVSGRRRHPAQIFDPKRSEEHTSELQSRENLVC